MSSDLVPRSSFSADALSKASARDVFALAENSAKIAEITKVANYELAQIGGHAIGTMAQLTVGATNIRNQLVDSGYQNDVYDDAHMKILQITGQNLILLTNAAQKAVMEQAAAYMR